MSGLTPASLNVSFSKKYEIKKIEKIQVPQKASLDQF
jgi:hypothetical protein